MQVLLICAVLSVATGPQGWIMEPPPLPPLGWEETITPGFDPPIEVAVVDFYEADAVDRWRYLQGWGPDAVPVLQRLYADPRWKEYQWSIRWYLELVNEPISLEPAFERLPGALTAHLEEIAGPRDGAYYSAYTQEHARSLERAAEVSAIIRDAVRADLPRTAEFIVRKVLDADEEEQRNILDAIERTGAPEGRALLMRLADADISKQTRRSVELALRRVQPSHRALQPVAVVVESENATP